MRYPPLPCKPLVAALSVACALGAFSNLSHAAAKPSPQRTIAAQAASPLAKAAPPPRQQTESRNVTLAADLVVKDAGDQPLLTLPAGTIVGRDQSVTRFAPSGQLLRRDARLKDVVLPRAVVVADPRNGEQLNLPEGTIVRLSSKQQFDAAGNLTRKRVALRAALPDGSELRIRDRSQADVAARTWVPPTARAEWPGPEQSGHLVRS